MKYFKPLLPFLLAFLPLTLFAQSFHVDMTKSVAAYTDETGYGIDDVVKRFSGENMTTQTNSQFISFKVPDGNYTVTMVIGSKKHAASTTVRAESRRLFVHDLITKKGKMETVSFVVNKRSPQIDDKTSVALKPREKTYLNWDNLLTIEITGDNPAVQSINVERNDTCPTVFLCGNSTVVDQNYDPWCSWGQIIPLWFNDQVAFANHAESGMATFSFLASHRLDKILSQMKKGDYVIVEFAHNDEKDTKPGKGAWYHFSYRMKIFIDQVSEKGGNIILCTPTHRRFWEDGNKIIKNTHGDYPDAIKAIAQREQIPLIDLSAMTKTFYETLGFEDSKRALVHYKRGTFEGQKTDFADNTHFNPFGAYEISKMIVMGLKQTNSPLAAFLRPLWQDFNPAQPDDWQNFHWTPSPLKEFAKPDGN